MPGENMLVFRDDAKQIPGQVLAHEFVQSIARVEGSDPSRILNALLLAGQMECGLTDIGHRSTAQAVSITNKLAQLLISPHRLDNNDLLSAARALVVDLAESLRISEAEGFAYYALHPLDFADVFAKESPSSSFAIVGIRSIGTTLSAVAVAELRSRSVCASRITVRPTGHPYNRETRLSVAERAWVDTENQRGSTFAIVDEGPGLSGSSFLSVGECLADLGVSPERILLIGTHDVNPQQLCAPGAASRWAKFKWRSVHSRIYQRFKTMVSLSGGRWRTVLLPAGVEWPASWQEMESLKFWSTDRRSIFKFDGLGQFGTGVREQATAIHEAGFGPDVEDAGDGTSRYTFVDGAPILSGEASTEILDRIADYCAFRSTAFKTSNHGGQGQLLQMVRHNFHEETGQPLELPDDTLCTSSPVIADARMQPYEWVRSANGHLLKVDASRHGDDHYLPGPTDICWDLAGAIVEWNMLIGAAEYLIAAFKKRSGIDSSRNLSSFVLAYSAFRMGYSRMALSGTHNLDVKERFRSAYLRYRTKMITVATTIATAA